jgi:hypothetical protein
MHSIFPIVVSGDTLIGRSLVVSLISPIFTNDDDDSQGQWAELTQRKCSGRMTMLDLFAPLIR